MLRSYLSAALGNLGRNWLYAGVTVLGLAVSFAAAILIGLYVRDEYTFERFIPDNQRIYRLEADVVAPGQAPRPSVFTNGRAAGFLKLDFPQVQDAVRIGVTRSEIKVGDVASTAAVVWADPGFFGVMAYPALAGDLRAALQSPDGLVLTRQAARRLFGSDAPMGRVLMVNPALDFVRGLPPDETRALTSFHPMRVLAVLGDIPSNTHLNGEIFASGRASFSALALDERHSPLGATNVLTYVKLKPGASADAIAAQLGQFGEHRYPQPAGDPAVRHFRLLALRDIHFADAGLGPSVVLRPSADRKVDAGIAGVGVLVVVIAALNFVALATARGARRAVEVGVRKALGARRRDLVAQFMGEALLQVAIAMVIAVALADMALGPVNAFLQRSLRFDYFGKPGLAAAIVGGALLTALLAGAYPALALSAFRPAAALKGAAGRPGRANVQQLLVVGQFGILIGLIVMTATVYRQTVFALRDSLRMDVSQVIWIATPCRTAFQTEVAALPGVKAAACASRNVFQMGTWRTAVVMPDRSRRDVAQSAVDAGYFELQGVKPLAGRLFSREHAEDMALEKSGPSAPVQPPVVLNESAVRALGFVSPRDAVGKLVTWSRFVDTPGPTPTPQPRPSQVVGVVPDFNFGSIRVRIPEQIYYVSPQETALLVIKLDGRAVPETLGAIRQLWLRTGHDRPIGYVFEDQMIQDLYRDVEVQGVVVAVCAGLAITIAAIGLFALAAFTTERRTKEIGVRKALGAGTADIVRLLLWQFAQPVLWANLIAWPAAFWAMDRWLAGFAYRVDLPAWLFLAASAAGVGIAWATVSVHTVLVARAKPAGALRYE